MSTVFKRAAAGLLANAIIGMPIAQTAEYIPSQFDKPFAGRMEVYYVPFRQVRALCNKLGLALGFEPMPYGDFMGCAMGGKLVPGMERRGIIVVGTDYDVEGTFRHERAHLNGWEHD